MWQRKGVTSALGGELFQGGRRGGSGGDGGGGEGCGGGSPGEAGPDERGHRRRRRAAATAKAQHHRVLQFWARCPVSLADGISARLRLVGPFLGPALHSTAVSSEFGMVFQFAAPLFFVKL